MASSRSDTSAQILDVSLGLFADSGYAAASMRAIARAVGIDPASLYHHFRSKEDILWSLTADAWSALEAEVAAEVARLPSGASPTERLLASVRAHVRFHAAHARSARLVNSSLDALNPERRAAVVERRDRYEQNLRHILDAGVAAGSFAITHPAVTSMAVLQLCSSVARWFDPDGPLGLDDITAEYEQFVLRIVAAAPTTEECP